MTEQELAALIGKAVDGKMTEFQKQYTALQDKYKVLHDDFRAQAAAKGVDVPAGILFGRYVRAATLSQGNPEKAISIIDGFWPSFAGAKELKAYFEIAAKTQTATIPSEGGILVPEVLSARVIEQLYANTAVQSGSVLLMGSPLLS